MKTTMQRNLTGGAFQAHPRGCLTDLWVVPGASRTHITGLHEGMLRVRLDKPAHDNRANKELVSLLRQCFKVKPELLAGKSSRHKIILLPDLSNKMAVARLNAYLSQI